MNHTASKTRRAAFAIAAGLVLAAPMTASAAGDRAAGLAKTAVCVACHGHDGLSRRPDVPNIAGQPEMYLRDQLEAYRSGERSNPNMSVVAQSLSDEDIANLAAWYSGLELSVECPECP